MKSIKIKICAGLAIVAFATGLSAVDANAQQAWNQAYPPTCSERGGCRHGNESLNLIPYGQSFGNGIAVTRSPYRDTLRASYQNSLHDYSGGCGYGGACGQSLADQHSHVGSSFDVAGRFPHEQWQFEQASYDLRSTYGNQRPYLGYESNSSFNTHPNYVTPSQRSLGRHQQTPTDRRPDLRANPSLEPRNSYGQNESRLQSRGLTMPPTSPQITPPPELPPQPSALNSRPSMPLLMPPTNVPSNQQSAHNHAGHDHSGHEHSDHNH